MNTYICSTITYRNHGSCCFNDFCYLNERTDSSACGFYSIHGITLYPRVSYGLRQSTLINCSASRRILGGNGFCKPFYGRDHSYEFFCRVRRERRLACLIWEKERREEGGLGFDVGVQEILSLLDGGLVKESEREDGRIDRKTQNVGSGRNWKETSEFPREGSHKFSDRKGGFSGKESKSKVVGKLDGRSTRIMDETVNLTMDGRRNSRKKEIFGGSDSSTSNMSEAMAKSGEKYSFKMRNSSRIDEYEERKESSDMHCSVSLSGDYESKDVILTSDQGFLKKKNAKMVHMREAGKKSSTSSLSNYENSVRSDLGQEKIGVLEEKQFQKHANGRYYGESSTRDQAVLEKIGIESTKQKVRTKRDEMEYNRSVSLSTQDNAVKWVSGKQSETCTGTTMMDKEENSTSVVDLDWESREQYDQKEQQVSGSSRQNELESEVVVVDKSERYSAQHREQLDQTEQQVSEKRESWRQNNVEMEIGLVDESERFSAHQNSFFITDQSEECDDGQMDGRSTGKGTSERVWMPPSPQSIGRGSMGIVTDVQPLASAAQEAFVEPICSGSGIIFTNIQGEMPQNSHKFVTKTRRDENSRKSSEFAANNDALASAICLDESSEKFIGEFVDRVQQEILISRESQRTSIQTFQREMLKSSETTSASRHSSVDASTVYQHDGLDEKTSDNSHTKEDDSRSSSGAFVTKGPSDEIWDVAEPSSSEPSQLEAPEKDLLQMTSKEGTEDSSNAGNSIVRRSGQSLWSYIAELVRKGWGARVETDNSMLKMGMRTSSTESGSSEAWFSGHEHDDDENVKEDKNGMEKGPLVAKNQTDQFYPRQQASSVDDRKTPVEAASKSKDPLEQGPLSKDSSFLSGNEAFGRIGSSEQEISESSKPEVSLEKIANSDLTTEISERSGRLRLTKAVQIEGKEGELKQRRLKRNTQVQKERFEEWEEAFKLDTEQRKIDETFMREAMLEAKKASNIWEVPVGAVLVHDGKIIARGFNLVEDQRDSTAHAEMICIREASNVLRSWRLAGTTLYVTLEPCPMCAGAILQARIDTLVWGAPNKLLGADGSWISLFPSGEEGRTSSDQSSQMVAPIHPFHPNMTIRRGILASECSDLLQQFFQLRRKKKKAELPPSSMPISHPSRFLSKIHNIFSTIFCL